MRRHRRIACSARRAAAAGVVLAALAACGESAPARASSVAGEFDLPEAARTLDPPPSAAVDAGELHRPIASPDDAPAAADDVVIKQAPPIPKAERPDERTKPTSRHVWTAGWWRWDGAHYQWTAGRWQAPPKGMTEWVPAHYVARDDGYVFVAGRWR